MRSLDVVADFEFVGLGGFGLGQLPFDLEVARGPALAPDRFIADADRQKRPQTSALGPVRSRPGPNAQQRVVNAVLRIAVVAEHVTRDRVQRRSEGAVGVLERLRASSDEVPSQLVVGHAIVYARRQRPDCRAAKKLTMSGTEPAKTLERVRRLCLAYPEASERLSHGAPCFFVREKSTFVMFVDNHHGDGRRGIWCAAPEGAQAVLVAADPELFFRPPYVGVRGWIGVRLKRPDWKLVAALIDDAYRTIAPPKLVARLGEAAQRTSRQASRSQARSETRRRT